MPQTLILAKSTTEANSYAKVAGLDRFTYRAVRSAGSIRGVRHAEVHMLSSFLKRPDKHAIMGALRWARTLKVYYVDFRDGKIHDGSGPQGAVAKIDEVLASHDVFGLGPSARELEVAYRYNALRNDPTTYADDGVDVSELLEDYDPVPSLVARGVISDPEEPGGEETGETEPSEDPAPVAPKRRRSRCPKCSQLHFKDESCVAPDPEPAADDFFA